MVMMPGQSPWRSNGRFIGLDSSENHSMPISARPGARLT